MPESEPVLPVGVLAGVRRREGFQAIGVPDRMPLASFAMTAVLRGGSYGGGPDEALLDVVMHPPLRPRCVTGRVSFGVFMRCGSA